MPAKQSAGENFNLYIEADSRIPEECIDNNKVLLIKVGFDPLGHGTGDFLVWIVVWLTPNSTIKRVVFETYLGFSYG